MDLVLQWVPPEDEPVVRAEFEQALAVRKLGAAARDLADRYFFETVVRIHRAGEGAPYTGLTDHDPEPVIAATDRALEQGTAAEVEEQLVAAVRAGLSRRFEAAKAARQFRPGEIGAGRAFVGTYVPLTHWVEGILTAADGDHHGAETHVAQHAPAVLPPSDGEHAVTRTSNVRYLPWMLTVALAMAVLLETAFLLRCRAARV